jgi:hypothetical protein
MAMGLGSGLVAFARAGTASKPEHGGQHEQRTCARVMKGYERLVQPALVKAMTQNLTGMAREKLINAGALGLMKSGEVHYNKSHPGGFGMHGSKSIGKNIPRLNTSQQTLRRAQKLPPARKLGHDPVLPEVWRNHRYGHRRCLPKS